MGVLSLLSKLRNEAGSVVQKVAQPIGRAENGIVAMIERPIVKAWQTVDPNSGYNQAKPIVQQAQARYGFTPQLSAIVNGGNPTTGNQFGGNPLSDTSGQIAGAYVAQNPVNRIQITGRGIPATDTLVHEALHRQWDLNPADHSRFISAYNQGANPILRGYLANRLSTYKGFTGGPTRQLMDINQAVPDIQDEIHSYIPEFYASHPDYALDGPLADYYSKYYDVSGPLKYVQKGTTKPKMQRGR